MLYYSQCNFVFKVVDAFDDAEVLASVVLSDDEQAARVHIGRVHIHHEVLEVLQLLLGPLVVRKQFLDEGSVFGGQWLVVRVAAEDVFEQTLDLVDVGVLLSSELKLLHFLTADASSTFPLSLLLFVVVFPEIVDYTVIMVAMFLPKLV